VDSYALCVAETGVVTITATPNPSIAEGDLPDCWDFWGYAGGGRGTWVDSFTFTIDKTEAGVGVVECTAGYSEKTVKMYFGGINLTKGLTLSAANVLYTQYPVLQGSLFNGEINGKTKTQTQNWQQKETCPLESPS